MRSYTRHLVYLVINTYSSSSTQERKMVRMVDFNRWTPVVVIGGGGTGREQFTTCRRGQKTIA